MRDDVAKKFFKEVDSQIAGLMNGLSAGSAVDYPSYMKMVGQINGLLRAKDALSDAIKSSRKDDSQED